MKKVYFLLSLLLSLGSAFAQENHLRNSKWFAYNSQVDFAESSFPGTFNGWAWPQSTANPFESSIIIASVCDHYGNPLIVVNNYGEIQAKGQDLGIINIENGNVIIVPKPNRPNRYYIISSSSSYGLNYREVDLTNLTLINESTPLKNAGGQPILSSIGGSGIASTTHVNGTDYWVTAFANDNLMSYLVTENGINTTPSSSASLSPSDPHATLKVKISPKTTNDEKRIAVVNFYNGISLQSFNDETGEIANDNSAMNNALQQIMIERYSLDFTKDAEFSSDGSILYYITDLSDSSSGGIYAIQDSGNPATLELYGGYIAIQRGPDGYIYTLNGGGRLYRIDPNNPVNLPNDTQISLFYSSPFQTFGILPQLVCINDCLATAVTPTFANFASIQDGDITDHLPTTSDISSGSIQGTWTPSTLLEGNHTYTFTPSFTTGQCAEITTMEITYIKPPLIDAVNDEFTISPQSAITPSVLNNDYMNDATLSYVSLQTNDGSSETYFSACNGSTVNFSDFFSPDGKYDMSNQCFKSGTYLLTYKITSNYCSGKYDTAVATIHYSAPFGRMAQKVEESVTGIAVYPNPSTGIFNIDLAQETEEYNTVEVFNMLGSKVYESRLSSGGSTAIDLSGMTTGCYIAKVSGKDGSKSFQLIKK